MKIAPWVQPAEDQEFHGREDIDPGDGFQAVIVEADGRRTAVAYSSGVAATATPLHRWGIEEL